MTLHTILFLIGLGGLAICVCYGLYLIIQALIDLRREAREWQLALKVVRKFLDKEAGLDEATLLDEAMHEPHPKTKE